MKKIICFLIMAVVSIVPIYYIAFWEPEESASVSSINMREADGMVKESKNIKELGVEEGNANTNLLKEEETDTKPILRTGKTQIEEKISEANKNKIKDILLQLSTVDLNRIEEILKNKDQDEATKEIINLLKKRLSLKDYKEIEKILVPYINFDRIT